MIEQPLVHGGTIMAKVLIVDDMEANRAVMSRRLERYGYDIQCVSSGAAALQAVSEALPDIMLLDYMMPQMSGIEVLRALRKNPETRDLPVIMVTARAESEATIEALDAGADDYVTKPIDFDVLRARIETHFGKRSSADDLKRANAALDERVTQRSMTIADLEEELRLEVERRRKAERRLGEAGKAQAPVPQAEVAADIEQDLMRIAERYEIIFANATAGKTPNLAQMAELRRLLAELRQKLT